MSAALSPQRTLPCCAIQHTETVEDYLKTIYHLSAPTEPVTTSTIASRLQVAPATVSAMLNRLQGCDLVEHTRRGRVVLTGHGERHALSVIRRHRLLETFLHRFLDLGWDEVHAEAETLEHALSQRLEDRIDAALGHPDRDPHGDPIPPRTGPHEERSDTPLDNVAPGDRFVVRRVSDRDSTALRYLADLGIRPGVSLLIEDRAPFGGPLWVVAGGRRHALGSTLVRLIRGCVVTGADQPTDQPTQRRCPDDPRPASS
jgi:DtxR family transcriptional regulator, Mn-dependent transcriptional regulator